MNLVLLEAAGSIRGLVLERAQTDTVGTLHRQSDGQIDLD